MEWSVEALVFTADKMWVERSVDGEHFERVADIGVEPSTTHYKWEDREAPALELGDALYYRVGVADHSGHVYYSQVGVVSVAGGASLVDVVPVAGRYLMVYVPGGSDLRVPVQGDVEVGIIDVSGAEVKSWRVPVAVVHHGGNLIPLPPSLSGVYWVRVRLPGIERVIKLGRVGTGG